MKSGCDYEIYSLGENALTIDFGNRISVDLNNKVRALASALETNSFDGFIECVPAYSTLTVFFNLALVRKSYPEFGTAFSFVRYLVESKLKDLKNGSTMEIREIEIPASFDKNSAPDIGFIAETKGLSTFEVIDFFLSKTYRVFMIGFLPGFAYMGKVDDSIATPRRETPRMKIPKGSIGIAGNQTGIYPLESPGGWQIIGQTNKELFTPKNNMPTLLCPGDIVKFVKE